MNDEATELNVTAEELVARASASPQAAYETLAYITDHYYDDGMNMEVNKDVFSAILKTNPTISGLVFSTAGELEFEDKLETALLENNGALIGSIVTRNNHAAYPIVEFLVSDKCSAAGESFLGNAEHHELLLQLINASPPAMEDIAYALHTRADGRALLKNTEFLNNLPKEAIPYLARAVEDRSFLRKKDGPNPMDSVFFAALPNKHIAPFFKALLNRDAGKTCSLLASRDFLPNIPDKAIPAVVTALLESGKGVSLLSETDGALALALYNRAPTEVAALLPYIGYLTPGKDAGAVDGAENTPKQGTARAG